MITITGSLAFDYIMDFKGKFGEHFMADKLHQISVSFLIDSLSKQRGGNSGNISYTLSLLNTPASILSTAGNDFSEYDKFLKDHGIDTSHIKILDSKSTATAFIMTDLQDSQISAFYPGAMSENTNLSLNGIKTDLVVITPDIPEAMVKFAKECQDQNTPYMLDPGMQLPALSSEDLKNMIHEATILVLNDYELSLLTEKTNLSEEEILKQVKILIITLGEKGSVIKSGSEALEVAAAKATEVLDPTGAGDAYRSGFLAGYVQKLPLKTCGQMGSIASCYAIEKYGTSNHKFTIQEFCERYKQNFGEELELKYLG